MVEAHALATMRARGAESTRSVRAAHAMSRWYGHADHLRHDALVARDSTTMFLVVAKSILGRQAWTLEQKQAVGAYCHNTLDSIHSRLTQRTTQHAVTWTWSPPAPDLHLILFCFGLYGHFLLASCPHACIY